MFCLAYPYEFTPCVRCVTKEGSIGSLFGEYRGYGGSGGSPALVSMLDDALAVVDAAGVPPDRIVLYGCSDRFTRFTRRRTDASRD